MPRDSARPILLFALRRALPLALVWGLVFGAIVAATATSYGALFPTRFARAELALAFGTNPGLTLLLGHGQALDTAAGFTVWRALTGCALVGAVWAMTASTKALRGEEDAGRWEVLLAGPTTQRRATAAILAGLGLAWLALFAVVALVDVVGTLGVRADFPVGGLLFLAFAQSGAALLFLALGALASQLARSRRQALAILAGVLGFCYLVRALGDGLPGWGWLAWVSPLGWIEAARPLTAPQPLALVPLVALALVASWLALALAARRDAGASILAERKRASSSLRLLGSVPAFLARQERAPTLIWWGALALGCFLLGTMTRAVSDAFAASPLLTRILGAGAAAQLGATSFLSVIFLLAATLLMAMAAGQVGRLREEEAEGRLDNLLVRPVRRLAWLAGGLGVALVALLVAAGVACVFAWWGARASGLSADVAGVAGAGVGIVAAGVLVLGAGVLAWGVAPRVVPFVTYGLVAWSFLVEMVGNALQVGPSLVRFSVLDHLGRAPQTPPDWAGIAGLLGLGAAAILVGAWAFAKRDLASA